MGELATVCVQAGDQGFAERARAVGHALGLTVAGIGDTLQADLVLQVTGQGLMLAVVRSADTDLRRSTPVRVDLLALDTQSGPGRSLQLPLAKAVGIHKGDGYRPRVIDATGGFGEDAWLLASWGCQVLVIERHPVMAAMLADGLERARRQRGDVAGRIRLVARQAETVLESLEPAVDDQTKSFGQAEVVYLDPMYPAGRKTVERKAMRILRMLVGDDEDSERLFQAACAAASRRVVVKRPARAGTIGGRPADAVHRGRGHRFDVYLTRK